MTRAIDSARNRRIGDDTLQQRLLARARFLAPQDYALLRAALDNTMPRRHLAQILGIPEGTLARRLNRMIARLYDPTIVTLIEQGHALRQEVCQLALEHLLQRKSIAELSDVHQMTRAQVRAAIQFARGWARGINTRKT